MDAQHLYRIVLIDDSRMARLGLREQLNRTAEFRIVGEAASIAEGLELIEKAESRPGAAGYQFAGRVGCAGLLSAGRRQAGHAGVHSERVRRPRCHPRRSPRALRGMC